MANNTNSSTALVTTTTNKGNRKLVTVAPATSPVALQPNTHSKPVAPSSQPAENWQIVGKPSAAKKAVAGVGPCPGPTTVGYALLQALVQAGSKGCTIEQLQAAIDAQKLRYARTGKHGAKQLMDWLGKERGYSFECKAGAITCTNCPSV